MPTQTLKSGQNDSAEIAGLSDIVGIANEMAIDGEGWTVIPYGMHPHSMGMQQFGRDEATKMVGYFRGTWNRIKRAITGLPVFNGHPDLPSMANTYPDKAEYGQVADMQVWQNGLAVKMVLSAAGAKLIEMGKKFISPHWLANETGRTSDGKVIFAPVYMKSIGLTDTPNIANPTSLLNSAASAEESSKKNKMKDALIKLLGLANEANEQQIEARISELLKRPEPSALANEQTARTLAEGNLASLTNEVKTLKINLDGVKIAFANERKARSEELIAKAIIAGKITEADKAVWEKRLERDFEDESKALVNSVQVVKTEALTKGSAFEKATEQLKKLADASGEESGESLVNSAKKIGMMVNAEKAKLKAAKPSMSDSDCYNNAFANVKKANPKLFAAQS